MIELTEALVLSRQINQSCLNKKIINVIVNQNPHKWAWFNGDPNDYPKLLLTQSFKHSKTYGGMIEIDCEHTTSSVSRPRRSTAASSCPRTWLSSISTCAK